MALKRLKVRMAQPAPEQSAGDIPVIGIEGDLIQQYNDADKQMKEGKGLMEELRPDVLEIALQQVFERSVKRPLAPTPSVKLQDEQGETLLVCFTAKYGECADVKAAEELFDNHDVDVNDYMVEGVKASFDSSVFYDEDGNFQQEVYDDIRKAVQTIVTKRGLAKNPLETAKIIKPKPNFHEARWGLFPKVETQVQATEILPNSTTIKPVRTEQKAAKKKK